MLSSSDRTDHSAAVVDSKLALAFSMATTAPTVSNCANTARLVRLETRLETREQTTSGTYLNQNGTLPLLTRPIMGREQGGKGETYTSFVSNTPRTVPTLNVASQNWWWKRRN